MTHAASSHYSWTFRGGQTSQNLPAWKSTRQRLPSIREWLSSFEISRRGAVLVLTEVAHHHYICLALAAGECKLLAVAGPGEGEHLAARELCELKGFPAGN